MSLCSSIYAIDSWQVLIPCQKRHTAKLLVPSHNWYTSATSCPFGWGWTLQKQTHTKHSGIQKEMLSTYLGCCQESSLPEDSKRARRALALLPWSLPKMRTNQHWPGARIDKNKGRICSMDVRLYCFGKPVFFFGWGKNIKMQRLFWRSILHSSSPWFTLSLCEARRGILLGHRLKDFGQMDTRRMPRCPPQITTNPLRQSFAFAC